MRVLLIDDDDRLAAMLTTWLAGRGVSADHRADGTSGLAAAKAGAYDAAVLDGMLPDLDGLEVLKRLRVSSDLPVVMLTARGDETDRIVGLELGADDYLPKPFNPRELLARLNAVTRRRAPSRDPVLRFGELEIDRDRREVRVAGETRSITQRQFDILRVLAEAAGRTLSRGQLAEAVTGTDLEPFDRSIDVHVSRIRAVVDDVDPPRRILTIRGAGYRFVP